jgi:hypothetical protein
MRSMFSRALVLCGLAGMLAWVPGARADELTYDFTVTATSGPLSGTVSSGSFSFDSSVVVPAGPPAQSCRPATSPCPPTGGNVAAQDLLDALDFTWDSISYNATTANTGFLNFDASGNLISFCFGNHEGAEGAGGCAVQTGFEQWTVDGSEFIYSVPGGNAYWFGNVTFAPVSATPEPGTLVLLGTGLLGVLALGLRKSGGLLSRRV